MSKRTWLKNTACIISIFVLTLAVGVSSAADKPNFSGTWTFNPQKSKLQSRFPITAGTFVIDHQGPRFHFSRVFVMSGKEDSFSYDLTAGGPEEVTTNPGRTLYSRLYWEGDVLIYSVRIVLKDGREATNIVRYSLGDEGRTFVAEESFRGPVLKYDNLWVADKKA